MKNPMERLNVKKSGQSCEAAHKDKRSKAAHRRQRINAVISVAISIVMVVSLTPSAAYATSGANAADASDSSGNAAGMAGDTSSGQGASGLSTQRGSSLLPASVEGAGNGDLLEGEGSSDGSGQAITYLEAEGPVESVCAAPDGGPTNEELLNSYAQKRLDEALPKSGISMSTQSLPESSNLTDAEKTIAGKLKPMIAKVASGDESSTVFKIPIGDVFAKTSWTESELGVPIVEGGAISSAAMSKAIEIGLSYDAGKVIQALLTDCPYELYWYEKTIGTSSSRGYFGTAYDDGELVLTASGPLRFSMAVANEYCPAGRGNRDYTVDTSKAKSIQTAVTKAQSIVADHKNEAPYQRLKSYCDEICTETSYNEAAAKPSWTLGYGNPWQLIWVFDNDPNTTVVCEGYSKAFQYLCDLSKIPDVNCYTVTGTMTGGKGEGAHMWNVVNMDDGKNYLVDVTNCDEGTIGYQYKLFMKHSPSGVDDNGRYNFSLNSQQINYLYDDDTTTLLGESNLELSTTEYAPPADKTSIADAAVQVGGTYTYNGSAQVPQATDVTVTLNDAPLEQGTDYEYTVSNNVYAGTATVTVSGIGDYRGTATGTFTIERAKVKEPQAAENLVYSGKAQVGVAAGEGYTLSGTAIATNAGSYTATATLDANYAWTDGTVASKSVSWSIASKPVKPVVTLEPASYVYNGKVCTPKVTVKADGATLASSQYALTWANGRKDAGSYKATVNLKGNYSGTGSATFKIIKAKNTAKVKVKAKRASLSKLKKKAQAVAPISVTKAKGKVTYAKVAKGSAKQLTVNKKTGKVTVKKGTKKGTYSIKVKVTAKGDKNYKSLAKTITAKVTVK